MLLKLFIYDISVSKCVAGSKPKMWYVVNRAICITELHRSYLTTPSLHPDYVFIVHH